MFKRKIGAAHPAWGRGRDASGSQARRKSAFLTLLTFLLLLLLQPTYGERHTGVAW